ncbi:PepSY domain-containing protein [uncultured Abiotrophia sp.]|uniref:PepSY domain-containing protein n=1 Tax=uncultured Abiotrophia sp. TaxID=316094 RepID=UPI00262A69AE|nr:PepSY domain-containing protein [uncultured Abiotrophia sp.]
MTLKKKLASAFVVLSLTASLAPTVLAQSSSSSSDSSSTAANASSNETTKQNATTYEQVTKTAEEFIKSYREAHPKQDLTTVELKYDDDLKFYVVEFEAVDDENEYELKINAGTGAEVAKSEQSLIKAKQGGVERREEGLNLEKKKDFKDIKAAAEAAVDIKGFNFDHWELDREGAATVWSLTYKKGDIDVEVKVDAQSGQVVGIDDDRLDD